MSVSNAPTALLLLIGGRQTPNILSAQFLRPQIIAPIASQQALQPGREWDKVKPILKQLSSQLLSPQAVNAFDLNDVQTACTTIMQQYHDMHWICNITCATTIMSIGAYEAGKACQASIWYFNTNGRQVVVLAGQAPQGNPYRLSVADYLQIYGRIVKPSEPPAQSWIDLAWILAGTPDEVLDFRELLRQAKTNTSYTAPRWLQQLPLTPSIAAWLPNILAAGLIDQVQAHSNGYDLHQCHPDLWKFFDGLWLEIVAWDAARRAGCFDDCCFGVEIPVAGQSANNQIDLALTFAASMLIGECKTEKDPFKTAHLDQLSSIADMIGGSFVGKLFITARSRQQVNPDTLRSFEDQAKAREIVVVTGEQLTELPSILEQEARKPTYPRV
ncbi:Card1-like endonuclease domain-containing protein [Chloroflexus sp.]|uniref:Card1-like endonuclease domain-containing protein n=1 Tax=Chloroflexus sp. TaxID=1904827 RepID=UPI002631A2F5|nr:DUF1887 family CARF protein [uncultured Chloroflexus sp.]